MTHPSDRTTADPGTPLPIILPLAALDAGMLDSVGGKAANLGELISAGFPVPDGFCITTEAYRQIADGADLTGLLTTAGQPGPAKAADWSALAAQARDAILRTPIPAAIEQAILAAYQGLGKQQAVAVRSSATAEDLPFASFAGQQDTFLAVLGGDQLLDAVRRCWASLWTERAAVYRATQDIDHRTVRLAVIVQTMVRSEVAGVLFTANPVTGRRREAVIDASPGLGEAVVSGAVTPDHLVVDTASGRLLETRMGDKQFAILALPGGGTEKVSSTADRLCITTTQATELARMGDRVERHFQVPQDIEWAFEDDGKLWLTQSRPITTLFPLPEQVGEAGLRVYFCFSVAQGLNRPITPMGLAAFRVLTSGAARLFGLPPPTDIEDGPRAVRAGRSADVLRPDRRRTQPHRAGRHAQGFRPDGDPVGNRHAGIVRPARVHGGGPVTSAGSSPGARIAARFRIPVYAAQALISPAAAHRRVARIEDDLQVRLAIPARRGPGAAAAARCRRAVRRRRPAGTEGSSGGAGGPGHVRARGSAAARHRRTGRAAGRAARHPAQRHHRDGLAPVGSDPADQDR